MAMDSGRHAAANLDFGSQVDAILAGAPIVRPFWDPVLANDRGSRLALRKKLCGMGLGGFRRGMRAKIGFFGQAQGAW